MEARRLVWELNFPVLKTYEETFDYFKKNNYRPIRISNNGKNYDYCFNCALDQLVIEDAETKKIITSVCPYKDCKEPTGNGKECIHLKQEMRSIQSRVGNKIFDGPGINSKAIHAVMDRIVGVRGFSGWKTKRELATIAYSIGKNIFVDNDIGIAVVQAQPHSRSLGILNLQQVAAGLMYSCAAGDCSKPAAFKMGVHHYCYDDYMIMHRKIQEADSSKLVGNAYMAVMNILGDKNPVIKDLKKGDVWLKVLKYIQSKGVNGFYYTEDYITEIIMYVSICGQLRHRVPYSHSVPPFRCIGYGGCIGKPGLTKSIGYIQPNDLIKNLFCESCGKAPRFNIKELCDGVGYGSNENLCLMYPWDGPRTLFVSFSGFQTEESPKQNKKK